MPEELQNVFELERHADVKAVGTESQPTLRLPFTGELQGALADGVAEGLVGGDGVEPFGPLSRVGHKPGGQIPRKTHNRRHGNQSSWFIRRVATVARPMAVRPTMRKPSLDHAKWCFQTSTRGLNSGTVYPFLSLSLKRGRVCTDCMSGNSAKDL